MSSGGHSASGRADVASAAPARRPAMVVLMASRTSASASSSGASRSERRSDAMPMTGAQRAAARLPGSAGGKRPSSMQRCTRASSRLLISDMNANRSYSRPMRGHVAVEEHEREVLRLFLAELVELPGVSARSQGVRWPARQLGGAEQAEPFFGQREEDVVLRREVAVDGARAVFDLRGDVADRHLRVAVGDEQLQRRIEDGAPDSLGWLMPSGLSTHSLVCSGILKEADPIKHCSIRGLRGSGFKARQVTRSEVEQDARWPEA